MIAAPTINQVRAAAGEEMPPDACYIALARGTVTMLDHLEQRADVRNRRHEYSQQAAIDWKEVARAAWKVPGWREAALEYHKNRPALPGASPRTSERLLTSEREIWRTAGHCIRRKAAHNALRTFLQWCDRHGVSRHDGLPIFQTIVDKELAK
jgi:hypothetical protein